MTDMTWVDYLVEIKGTNWPIALIGVIVILIYVIVVNRKGEDNGKNQI